MFNWPPLMAMAPPKLFGLVKVKVPAAVLDDAGRTEDAVSAHVGKDVIDHRVIERHLRRSYARALNGHIAADDGHGTPSVDISVGKRNGAIGVCIVGRRPVAVAQFCVIVSQGVTPPTVVVPDPVDRQHADLQIDLAGSVEQLERQAGIPRSELR